MTGQDSCNKTTERISLTGQPCQNSQSMIAGTGQRLESWETRVLGQAADTRQQDTTAGEDSWYRTTMAGQPLQERDDRTART
jgi:hypothetical protein